MKRFEKQVAIVVGGARGIGEGIARRLAKEGAKVIIFDVLEESLTALAQSFKELGLGVDIAIVDIIKEEQVQSAITQVVKKYNQLDILVNCAGIIGQTATKIENYETAVFNQVLSVNLTGAFLVTKHALAPMVQQNYGRILHISSIGGKEGNPGMVGYAASKAGMMGLVKGVGKEYAETGITVNGMAPAVIATLMNENTAPETLKYMVDKIPMKRLGTVEEAAALACWIVSREASFNTGFVFDLSGGRATY